MVPAALDSVAAVDVVLELIVINLPAVPFTLKLVNVVVVAAGNVTVRALLASEKLKVVNVLAPVTTSAPVEPGIV